MVANLIRIIRLKPGLPCLLDSRRLLATTPAPAIYAAEAAVCGKIARE